MTSLLNLSEEAQYGMNLQIKELKAEISRLSSVVDAARRVIRESRTQENGTEQIGVEPWVDLAVALAALD